MSQEPPGPAIDNARWVATVRVGDNQPIAMYSEREELDDAVRHIVELMSFVAGTEYSFTVLPYEAE